MATTPFSPLGPWNSCAQMLLRMRARNSDAPITYRLALVIRRYFRFSLSVDRKLEPPVSVPLLHNEEQSGMGTALDHGSDCERTGTGSEIHGEIFR
jgi:hypothetical protein